MICPKCEEGEITKIQFKRTGERAYLCNYCETVWLERETIDIATGHAIESLSDGECFEYILEDFEEKNQEQRPAEYKHYR